jgi:hypothetical protein
MRAIICFNIFNCPAIDRLVPPTGGYKGDIKPVPLSGINL